VFIAGQPDHGAGAILGEYFGLTPSETRVLEDLLEGQTLSQTAMHLGIAASTAKTHLDHIFAKVGVSRQTELIRQAAQLLPPVRAPGAERGDTPG
jgi:DNA-binding CsgD family transcriptional regulator